MLSIRGDFERASIDVSASSVSGGGDGALFVLAPLKELSWDIGGGQRRWLEPAALVSGVIATQPTFRFTRMLSNSVSVDGGYHYPPWQSTRRCMFSEDGGKTWEYFASTFVNEGAGFVEFRHDKPFTVDSVRIARARQIGPTEVGRQLAELAAANPGVFLPAPSAAAYTPSAAMSGYPAQEFIANEYGQWQEGTRTIPATPLYTAMIDDPALSPVGGGPKKIALLLAGLHSGEDHGTFVVLAMVRCLLGSSAAALALRRECRIIVHPLENARGRAAGLWRGSGQVTATFGDDPNRHWGETPSGLEVVDKPRRALALDFGDRQLGWGIDSHSAGDMNFGLPNGAFKAAVERASGLSIETLSPHFDGQASYWMRSIGFPIAVTSEVGDAVPATDASIDAFAAGLVTGFAEVLSGVTVPTPAPAPAPAPVPQPVPATVTPLVPADVGNGPAQRVEYSGTAADNLPAMTVMAYVRPTGQSAGLGYLLAKGNPAGGLRRFFVDHNGGQPRLTFGLGSAGATFSPSASSAPGSVVYGQWQHVEATWDGSLAGTGIALAVDGAASSGERTNGAGALTSDAGHPLVLCNRGDGARRFQGEIGWIDVWDYVLSVTERAQVRQNGPSAVPGGRVVSYVPAAPAQPPAPVNASSGTLTGTWTRAADGSITVALSGVIPA